MKVSLLQNLANSDSSGAFANKLRKNRMNVFENKFKKVLSSSTTIKILDLGGTWQYWKEMGYADRPNVQITLLNLFLQQTFSENICSISGDACDLSNFDDKFFDIVFSNSVIEHVGNGQCQLEMANAIIRVAKGYYIQTPNYWFPLEPHFLTWGFQFFPLSLRAFLLQSFKLGWVDKQKCKENAIEVADSVHLLSKNQLKKLFPQAEIVVESFLGLAKSFMVIQTNNM